MKKFFDSDRPLGIQLWTLKDEMYNNPKKTIENVAQMGYRSVELFEGEKGLLWGMKPLEFKRLIEEQNLEVKSTHFDPFNDFEKKVEQAAEFGLEYLTCAWLGPNDSLDFYKKALDRFSYCADVCHEHGIKFAYHNHDYSLRKVEGVMPQKLFLEQIDPHKMTFEMDVFWVVLAGYDPLEWIRKYSGRWKMAHIKDLALIFGTKNKVSTIVGQGIIDYKDLLPKMLEEGVVDFYVEQEEFAGTAPMTASQESYRYLIDIDAIP